MNHDLNNLGQPVGWLLPDWRRPEPPSPDPMTGRFCRLEKLNPPVHTAGLHAANSLDAEGRMWTYLPYGPFASLESYRAWTEEVARSCDPLFYTIVDAKTDQPVGVAAYLRIDPSNGSIEVGHLGFSPRLQRTPAATEAMYLMMERAFSMGYRRYEWKCHSLNSPSRHAAQRLGFSLEGIFRQAIVVKGRSRDTAWYSIIDAEWPALRPAFRCWLHPANFDEKGGQRVRLSDLISLCLPTRPGPAGGVPAGSAIGQS